MRLVYTVKQVQALLNDPRTQAMHVISDIPCCFSLGYYNLINPYPRYTVSIQTLRDHFLAVANDYGNHVSAKADIGRLAEFLYELITCVPIKKIPLYINHEHCYVQAVAEWRLKIGY